MTEQSHLPIEDKFKAAIKAVEPNSEFSESLWQQLSHKQAGKPQTSSARVKFFQLLRVVALTLLVIALAIMIIGPQEVVNAFNSLFGYLPDAGFVEDALSTLYLAEPITVEQGGMKLTVQQVVADRNNVVVTYELTGKPEGSLCVFDSNRLRLPDGKTKLPVGGGISGTQAHIYYQPLPEGVTTLTLLVSQQSSDPACGALPSWSIDLALGPRPADVALMPVTQGQDLQVSTQTVVPVADEESTEVADVHFTIDKIAELTDAYVVSGHVSGSNPAWNDLSARPDYIQVSDANGTVIPIEQTDDDVTSSIRSNSFAFAFKFAKGDYANPLRVEFQSVVISALFDGENTFTFDAGVQPQVGQSWTINETFNLLGREVTITTVSAIHDDAISNDPQVATGYTIQTKADSNILGLGFHDVGLALGKGTSGGTFGRTADGTHTEMDYPNGLPTGTVTYQVIDLQYVLNGSWQLQFQLPSPTQ